MGLRQGLVEGIAWDRNCGGVTVAGVAADQCSAPSCLDGFCRSPCSDATPRNGTAHPCDLKVYLAWKGRDANRRAMMSAGNLPNNFNIFSARPAFEDVAGLSQDFVYGLLNALSAGTSLKAAPLLLLLLLL